jgi:TonB family protein
VAARSEVAASFPPGEEFYVWKFPGSPKRIHICLETVERLRREVVEKAQAHGGQGAEIGGLLLGSFSRSGTEVEIRDYQTLPCESRSEGRYALSTPTDIERLEAAIAEKRRGLRVVGSFRSHLREGLCLDEQDLNVCQIWFADPAHVFLVVKPARDGNCEAGFFFWDHGEIQAAFSFMEFPFDARLLRRARVPETNTREAPAGAETASAAVPPKAGRRRAAGRWIAAAAILAAVLLGAGYTHFRQGFTWPGGWRSPARQDSALGLRVETRGGDLTVSWNRNSREIRAARSGVLQIADGDYPPQEVRLDAAQLLNGSILYAPRGGRVQFRLDVEGESSASELVLAIIRGREPASPEQEAVVRVSTPAGRSAEWSGPAASTPESSPAPARPSRTFVPPPLGGAGETPARAFAIDPPAVEAAAAPLASPGPAMLSQARLPEPPPPAPESKPAAAPAAGINPPPRISNYVPPRVLRREQPAVPSVAYRTIIVRETRVEVLVSIDRTGKVTGAKIVSGPLPTIVSAAVLEAARRWTFEPARFGGQPAPAETNIVFQFRPSGSPR